MLELGDGSLLLVSSFGLLDELVVTLMAPVIGSYIDRQSILNLACWIF